MQTSYEMAFNVLGCGLNDPEYDVFLKHFGIAEEEVDVSQIMRFYGLPRRGLSLLYSRTSSCFWFVSFSFYTRSIADGLANPFDGAVYANIKGTDTPQEVMKKIGLEPYYRTAPASISENQKPSIESKEVNSICETYQVELAGRPPCIVDVSFEAVTARLNNLTMSFPDWHTQTTHEDR